MTVLVLLLSSRSAISLSGSTTTVIALEKSVVDRYFASGGSGNSMVADTKLPSVDMEKLFSATTCGISKVVSKSETLTMSMTRILTVWYAGCGMLPGDRTTVISTR